jgi:hypothetical protein
VRATNPAVIMNALEKEGKLDTATVSLFNGLRQTRNVAAHKQPIFNAEEASTYWDSTQRMLSQLNAVADRIEDGKK